MKIILIFIFGIFPLIAEEVPEFTVYETPIVYSVTKPLKNPKVQWLKAIHAHVSPTKFNSFQEWSKYVSPNFLSTMGVNEELFNELKNDPSGHKPLGESKNISYLYSFEYVHKSKTYMVAVYAHEIIKSLKKYTEKQTKFIGYHVLSKNKSVWQAELQSVFNQSYAKYVTTAIPELDNQSGK